MTIRKVWGSRVDQPVAESYVGQKGTIFFNEPGSGTSTWLRISDGHSVGGIPINVPPATTSTTGGITPGPAFNVSNNGVLTLNAGPSFTVDGSNYFQLKAATSSTIGGIKAGPGVIVASDGTLNIDSAGLSFSFGDFYAGANVFSTIGENEDVIIASNGTGTVDVIGQFAIYQSDGSISGALSQNPIFQVSSNGQTQILVPTLDSTKGAVEIIGALDGTFQTPVNTGVMLHVTGNPSVGSTATISRIYNDAQGTYSIVVGRRYNGTATNPQPIVAGDIITRYAANGYNTSGWEPIGQGRIGFTALENFTTSSQGTQIDFGVAPIGGTYLNLVTATIITATGTTSVRFFGPLTGNVNASIVTATTIIGTLNGTATTASFATTSGYAQSFNTNTVVTTAVNANTATIAANVAGGYVSNISGGTGTSVSTGTGAVTISTTATLQTINTWTPTLLFATQGTVTYSTRIGNYIKIGQQVTAFFSITITSYGTSAGAASIGGLPFLSENVTGVVGSLTVTATPTLATQAVIVGSMTGNTSTVALETYTAGGGPNPFVYGPATTTILGGTASFSGFVTYISAT